MMPHGSATKSSTPAGKMKKLWALVCVGVLWIIVPQARAQNPGDVGSAGCREVQVEVQEAVGPETNPPYRNHGKYVKAAAQAANPALEAGEITAACYECIVSQFAKSVPIANQESCGPEVPACGNCLKTVRGTGCEIATCQTAVCALDPVCCTTVWDSFCVREAVTSCLNAVPALCTGPRCGDCVIEHGAPGCEIATCQTAVCALDPVCCTDGWDSLCAARAVILCIDTVSPLCPQ